MALDTAAYGGADPVTSLEGIKKFLVVCGATVSVGEVVVDCGVGGAYPGGVSRD